MGRTRRNRGRPLKGDALRERVSFTLPPALHRELKLESKKRRVSKSDLVEQRLSGAMVHDQTQILLGFVRLKQKIREIARSTEIKRLSLFGSILSGEPSDQSDIDLLVEFNHGHTPGLFQLSKIEEQLSEIFGGKKVDLRTAEELSRYFRAEVKDSAIAIYES